MTSDSFKKLAETQARLHRQLEPLSVTMKALQADPGIKRAMAEANRSRDMIRAALGPIEELRRFGALDAASQLAAESRRFHEMIEQTQKRFYLPEMAETAKLIAQFKTSGAAQAIAPFHEQESEFRRAVEAMRTPWLDIEDKVRSLTGFAELQGIGHALRTMPAFDATLADRLRVDLGDWRRKIMWPRAIFTDPLARSEFYIARGLDPALTAFPASAFEQSITIAGIKGAPPPLIEPYDFEPEREEEDEEEGFVRTNAAHDRLQRFESQIRNFIDEQMTAAFGENWIKHYVPGPMRQAWEDKRQKARDSGAPERPLIAYADFTDYEPLITKKDNWNTVFKPVFKRPTLVQESFQRLYPVRICTMHARIITQDDELYLYAETNRLLAAIGIVI